MSEPAPAPVRAPELARPGTEWLNVAEPLSLKALAGRLVLLDFWTFCCINCLHVLATLRQVEEAFPTEVAVIGVHSPKFAAEKDAGNVRQAIARYDIGHPVLHDPEMQVWRDYAVKVWPTLVIVSPDGYVIGQSSGEPDAARLIQTLRRLLEEARRGGHLRPAAIELTAPAPVHGRLSFPGKIKPLSFRGQPAWAIADAGHHQVAVVSDQGRELLRLGSGRPGFADGGIAAACFNSPQGLEAGADRLFVADTGNHAIRAVDLTAGTVTTLAGAGQRGRALLGWEDARDAALASPWDLALAGDRLLFANAGTHQLGQIELTSGLLARLAGDGGEDIVDGHAARARLAQPSGLALSPARDAVFFVDSETSSLRLATLEERPRVGTLVGAGLFEFGHVNGPFPQARLQHPLGLAWRDGGLVVADSYNARLRWVDLAQRSVGDLDEGFLCEDALCLPLAEPAGIAAAGGRLLVSDTNNHRILEYRLSERAYCTWFC